jgi:hypothetical protein
MTFTLPWIPIVLAAIAYFILGAVWYGYFGEMWLKALHKRKEQLDTKDPTPYAVAAFGALLNAIAVAIVVGLVMPSTETKLLAAFVTALLLGGAVIAASAAKHYAFSGWSWRLYAIDIGHDLVGFFIMALIIALMQ